VKKNVVGKAFKAIVENPDVFAGVVVILILVSVSILLLVINDQPKGPEGEFKYKGYCMDGKKVYLMVSRQEDTAQFYVSGEKCDGSLSRRN